MRRAFAHDAVIELNGRADIGSPGAAITVFVCGSWDHDGHCPLAPHYTSAWAKDGHIEVRVLFAADPTREPEVRRLIESALASGRVPGEESNGWRLVSHGPSDLRPDEREHAARLAAGGD